MIQSLVTVSVLCSPRKKKDKEFNYHCCSVYLALRKHAEPKCIDKYMQEGKDGLRKRLISMNLLQTDGKLHIDIQDLGKPHFF